MKLGWIYNPVPDLWSIPSTEADAAIEDVEVAALVVVDMVVQTSISAKGAIVKGAIVRPINVKGAVTFVDGTTIATGPFDRSVTRLGTLLINAGIGLKKILFPMNDMLLLQPLPIISRQIGTPTQMLLITSLLI